MQYEEQKIVIIGFGHLMEYLKPCYQEFLGQNLVENLLFALLEDTPNRRKISQMTMTLLFLLLCGHTETMTFVPMA